MARFARHLKQNAVAYVALFFALGGVSLAASNALLDEKNVVHSRHIAPGAVHSSDLGNGAVRKKNLSPRLSNSVSPGPPQDGTYSGKALMQDPDSSSNEMVPVTISATWANGEVTEMRIAGQTNQVTPCNNQWPGGRYDGFQGSGTWRYSDGEVGGPGFIAEGGFLSRNSVTLRLVDDAGSGCVMFSTITLD